MRKVTMVVPVLMTSCQVSENPKTGPVAAHTMMTATAMANAAEPADISIDCNIVGRIGEDEVGAFVLQEMMEGRGLSRISAQQPMTIEQPQVCNPGHRHRGLGDGRDRVVSPAVGTGRRLSGFIEQPDTVGG